MIVLWGAAIGAPTTASWATDLRWHDPLSACKGHCAVHVSIGRFSDTPMTHSFGLNSDFIPDASDYVAPWNYDYKDAFLVSGTVSRRVLTAGSWASVEIEAGVGQRFGDLHATELWGAMYLRWHVFPWNRWLYTTAAVSTGFNYATKVEDLERQRDDNRKGSQLLHYLSPEITFALPERQEWELVLRYHHRSGGGGILGEHRVFNGVTGGSNFVTVGVRYRF